MATTVRVNGKTKARPGVYVQVDASRLESTGLGATGIVAILGTGVGGKPVASQGATSADRVVEMTGPDDFIRFNSPDQVRSTFVSGDLREAAAMLFNPSGDAAIPGGANQVVAMKVNPDKAATGTMDRSASAVINLTSRDFGTKENQIRYSLSAGSTQGYALTIERGSVLEAVDDLGGSAVAQVTYTPGTGTWAGMTASLSSAGSPLAATFTAAGAITLTDTSAHAANAWGSSAVVTLTNSAGDAGKVIRVYGTTATGFAVEDIVLGTTGATGTTSFTDVKGMYMLTGTSAAATITLLNGATSRFVMSAGQFVRGGIRARAMYVASTTYTATSSTGTQSIHVFSNAANGSALRETIAAGTGGTSSAGSPAQIEFISTVDIASGESVTLAATVIQTVGTVTKTLEDIAQVCNALVDVLDVAGTAVGFTWTNLVGDITRPLTKLDEQAALILASGGSAATASLTADTWAIIDWINLNSTLMTAAFTGTNVAAPDTFTSRYLSGGVDGTATFADWQRALDLLKQDSSISTIVALTGTQAVHTAVEAHCAFMCGEGAAERDAAVGVVLIDGSGVPVSAGGEYTMATKASLKSQAAALNSRHVRVIGQKIRRYSTDGVLTWFDPWFAACISAGMQAGSSVGLPQTWKYANVLAFKQDSSWNPKDDAEELIQAGVLFLEQVRGIGSRWVRQTTSYTKSTNLVFQEISTNAAVNYAARSLRDSLQAAIGQPAFPRTLAAVRGRAIKTLGLLINEGAIAEWQSLGLRLENDILYVSIELSPTLGINFVPTTLYLNGTTLAA